MKINNRSDIEKAFKEVLNTNPYVRKAMDMHRIAGDLSEREALMYAVVILASQNDDLIKTTIRKLETSPVPAILVREQEKEQ